MSEQKLTVPIAIIIAGVIIAGSIFLSKGSGEPAQANVGKVVQEEQDNKKAPTKEVAVNKNDHIRGNANAPVTIVEYSDFQCPFCSKFHPTMMQALEEYPNEVRWVFKHFPLNSIHPEATPAAEASECAGEQGKFWEFADDLFDNQSRLGLTLYTELAENSGLDMDQFNECVSSRKYQDKVNSDLAEGTSIGVRGTPGSFVNGEAVPGAVPFSVLKGMIDATLADL